MRFSRCRVRRIIAIGCALGLAGLALFAGLHAIVIKPVWGQLAGGIPFVIAIGVSVTWAYHEFAKAVPKRVCATGGLRFGALVWLFKEAGAPRGIAAISVTTLVIMIEIIQQYLPDHAGTLTDPLLALGVGLLFRFFTPTPRPTTTPTLRKAS